MASSVVQRALGRCERPICRCLLGVCFLLLFAACGYLGGFITRVFMTFGKSRNPLCRIPMHAYDYLCGGLLLGLCWALSVPQFCRKLQTKSLLSAVFERRIAHNEVMKLLDSSS